MKRCTPTFGVQFWGKKCASCTRVDTVALPVERKGCEEIGVLGAPVGAANAQRETLR